MDKENEATELCNEFGEPVSAPPGFASLSSFMLERVMTLDGDSSQIDDLSEICLGDRPWIAFDRKSLESEECEESESEQSENDFSSEISLPKGVIQGCADCSDCVNVKARWCPNNARNDVMKDAPVYYPTKEEFEDAAMYIAKIKPSAEPYGICRIVPPPSWHSPCVIKEKEIWENSRFYTRVQRIDGLQDRKRRGITGKGLGSGCDNGLAETSGETGSQCGREFTVKTFKKYADDFKSQYFGESETTKSNDSSTVSRGKWDPSVENIEGEYKRIVGIPSDEIEVLCCDESESRALGSGFPTTLNNSHHEVVKSCWNLNNVPILPRSLLSSEWDCTSPALGPRVRLGMCFSTHQWRVEEHHLYALCYVHMGAQKVWYAVPSRDRSTFQAALQNSSADESDEEHRLVSDLLPSALMKEGIPVFRCVLHRGEFVVIYPGVFHSAFDCGFNITETANFAPLDWLPYGLSAVKSYRDVCRKTLFSFDKLLLEAAFLAVKEQWEVTFCRKDASSNQFWKNAYGKEGILAYVFKSRVKSEETARRFLCNPSGTRKMDEDFGATTKRECKICLQDLHFSAAGCPCSPDTYSCLYHASQLCDTPTCTWGNKFFLFRHDIADLNLLAEAVQGILSSVFKYAREKLGLSLTIEHDGPISSSSGKPKVWQDHKSTIMAEAKARALQSSLNKRNCTEMASEPTKASNHREEPEQNIVAGVIIASAQDESRPFPNLGDASPTDSSSDDSNGSE